ncbi:MAG: twin-arginine translocase TatA/TatE family subunit [Planctomycetes bacterium]|nr:twin-arginine translocase TatA/TatE family subunit [Planctomycetota bacterium]MCA8946926.1 twin-arginine translocase TatA/TatE family subunit [Planctomycetota bacterium]
MNLSIGEILAIIVIGLVLFGGKLPDVARNLGVTLKEFKQGMHEPAEPEDEQERIADQTESSSEAETD